MKKIILFLCCLATFGVSYARIFDSLSIGVGGSFSNHSKFNFETYLQSSSKLFKLPAEYKVGVNNRPYSANFSGVNDLNVQSVGFFADAAIYPFKKYLFTGIRWELINLNWFSDDAKTKLRTAGVPSTSMYTGTCVFAVAGVTYPVSNNFSLKLYGMPGFQQYKISNGNSSSGNYIQNGNFYEDFTKFIFHLNFSVNICL